MVPAVVDASVTESKAAFTITPPKRRNTLSLDLISTLVSLSPIRLTAFSTASHGTNPCSDFTSLFNWNTKQVFVWITATYPSSNTSLKAPPSEAVIWDQIINSHSQSHPLNPFEYFQNLYSPPKKLSKGKGKKNNGAKKAEEAEVGIIKLKNAKPKYQITDITGKMAERENVTLQVGWNVQPWVGALLWTMPEGFELGRWKGVTGGTSKVFKMPSLKGKSASSETVVASGGTPKAAEASAVV